MDRIPETMTAVCLDETGKLNHRIIPVPAPGKGQVLVKIYASPVNPSDLAKIKHAVGTPLHKKITPGIEGSGKVVLRGKGILPLLWQGRRVSCSPSDDESGTWAEYMVTSASNCIPLPSGISDEQGSMLLVNPLTAVAFVKKAKAIHARSIVNTASAGTLGRMLEIIATSEKIDVINIVHNSRQKAELLSAGSKYVLDSSESDFAMQLKELAGRLNAGLVFDAVGGKMTQDLLFASPLNSTIIIYGNLSGNNPEVDHRSLVAFGKTVTGFYLARWLKECSPVELLDLIITARGLLKKSFVVPVQDRFALTEAQKAVDTYLAGMSKGKVLLVP